MTTPRLGSALITLSGYCRDVYRTTPEKWRALPIQWRGFVMHNLHRNYDVDTTLAMVSRDPNAMRLSPQGVYDAYQGHAPA